MDMCSRWNAIHITYHVHTYIHTYTHAYIHKCICIYTSYTYAHRHMTADLNKHVEHTYMHTRTHTPIHTHVHRRSEWIHWKSKRAHMYICLGHTCTAWASWKSLAVCRYVSVCVVHVCMSGTWMYAYVCMYSCMHVLPEHHGNRSPHAGNKHLYICVYVCISLAVCRLQVFDMWIGMCMYVCIVWMHSCMHTCVYFSNFSDFVRMCRFLSRVWTHIHVCVSVCVRKYVGTYSMPIVMENALFTCSQKCAYTHIHTHTHTDSAAKGMVDGLTLDMSYEFLAKVFVCLHI